MLSILTVGAIAAAAVGQAYEWNSRRIEGVPATLVLTQAGQPADDRAPAPVGDEPDLLEQLVDPSEPERIASGLKFTEGPVWVPSRDGKPGYLLFSDIPADTIYRLDPPPPSKPGETATPTVYRSPSGHSNGLMLDNEGRLLICEHEGRVVRIEKDDRVTVLAEKYEGKSLNSPNDLCVASDGSIYFTDPPYGVKTPGKARERELDYCGVFRIDPEGKLHLLVRDLTTPNGIALSPDEKTLYVANHGKGEIWAYPLDKGKVGAGKLLADLRGGGRGIGADGLRTDRDGNLYVGAARGGLHVVKPDGTLIGIIGLPTGATNLCFGGDDGRTLYVVALDSVYRMRVKIPGPAR